MQDVQFGVYHGIHRVPQIEMKLDKPQNFAECAARWSGDITGVERHMHQYMCSVSPLLIRVPVTVLFGKLTDSVGAGTLLLLRPKVPPNLVLSVLTAL